MPLLPTMSSSELSRLSRGIFGKLVVLALIVVPTLYAGLLTWSSLDATSSLDAVPAAVVNLDEPATVRDANGKKQTVPLGRVVAGQLVGGEAANNLNWQLTDADSARAGLEDGTYYAVLTIPKTFSKAATSTADPDSARQATMRLETNDATSYLAGNIAAAISTEVTTATGDRLTTQYLDRIYLGFNSLHANMVKAADGGEKLADGTGALRSGSAGLDEGAHQLTVGLQQLAGGTGQLASGNAELASGAAVLATGAQQLAAGNAQLASGLQEAADNTAALPGQAQQLADGAAALQTGAQQLSSGAGQLASGLDQARRLTAALPGQASALADGSGQLLTAVTQLGTAAGGLAEGAQGVADGGSRLADGAEQLATGASRLTAGTREQADGADALAGGAAGVSDGVDDYTRAVSALAGQCETATQGPASDAFCAQLTRVAGQGGALREGAAQTATGARALATGSEQLADGAADLAQGAAPLRTGADALAQGASRLDSGASQFATGAGRLSSGGDELGDGLRALAQGAPQLVSGAGAAADAADQLATGADEMATGAGRLSTGLDALAQGAPQLSAGIAHAADAAGQLSTGAGRLSTGATQLSTGAQQAATGARQVDEGARSAVGGSARLEDGIGSLRAGISQVDNGTRDLAKGLAEGAKQIPTYDPEQRDRLATVVAEPVGADGVRLHRVAAYGQGLAPYFVALGLWVGGMALFFMLRPLPRRAIASTAPSWRVTLAGFAPAAMFGVLQAAVLTAVLLWGLDLQIASPWLFLGFAVLASLTFCAINHALVAALGPTGRFLGLILIVLQLSAAGATYPIETSPGLFQWLHPLLPLTYAVRAFRSLIAGGTLHLGPAAAVMVCWLIAALLITLLSARRQRRWSVARLRPLRAA